MAKTRLIRFILTMFFMSILVMLLVSAQEDDGLIAENVAVVPTTNAFGQEMFIAVGEVINTSSDEAYTNINIFADVVDSSGEVIGEGFGFPVNACGSGLIDFALQPGESQPFNLYVEVFEEGEIDGIEIFPEGTVIEAQDQPAPLSESITAISDQEVVNLRWSDANSLIYGVGCDANIFLNLNWFSYDLTTEEGESIIHPDAEKVTEALLTQLGLTDPIELNRSFLAFPSDVRRIFYQNDINVAATAEPDGSFKRILWEDLSRRSLHGLLWMDEGRFLAYYYGAYGEPVSYFTASVNGERISADVYSVTPSMTIPGPSPDGRTAVITTTVDDITGYFAKDTFYPTITLLFEEDEIPGNNYPAPIYTNQTGGTFIYLVRPVDGEPTLSCFHRESQNLVDLTALPLELSTDDRAWTWLSPDASKIALAANGPDGGLWVIDLAMLDTCAG